MSLETVDDAKRIARLSRAEYDKLLDYLEQLPVEGWTEQSACADWKVYQAVSHIGSQPKITGGVLAAGLRGAAPMTDDERRAIWNRFDNLEPLEVLPAFRETNEAYFELVDSLSDDELGRAIPWIFGETPVAGIFAGRLNEQVLHAWDIRWARDRQVVLSPEAVPTLLEVNLTTARLAVLVKPERSEQLSGKAAQFELSEPNEVVSLHLEPGHVTASRGPADAPALVARLPAEAFIRLIWNRHDVATGLRSGQLELSQPELADALQALFPGR